MADDAITLDATHIEVEAEVRYWEDATVNGVEDLDGTLIPGRDGDLWKVSIELATGRIENWPQGIEADVHYKVCDQGLYWLATGGRRLAAWRGHYVPTEFLNQRDGGDDYVIFKVRDGRIEGWRRPGVDLDDWKAV